MFGDNAKIYYLPRPSSRFTTTRQRDRLQTAPSLGTGLTPLIFTDFRVTRAMVVWSEYGTVTLEREGVADGCSWGLCPPSWLPGGIAEPTT